MGEEPIKLGPGELIPAPGKGGGPSSPLPYGMLESWFSNKKDNAGSTDLGNKLWTIDSALNLVQRANAQLPSFTHIIEVSVTGGPKAKLERIWLLALSTAFGRYRQAGQEGIQGASLEGWWDITGKAVKVRLSYMNSGVIEVVQGAYQSTGTPLPFGIGGNIRKRTSSFIYNGPTQETIGGNRVSWVEAQDVVAAGVFSGVSSYVFLGGLKIPLASDSTNQTARIGLSAAAALSAVMLQSTVEAKNRSDYPFPDAGRLITTATKTNVDIQPPTPSGDGISRTSPFIALVSNALTDPGYLPASPPQSIRRKKQPKFFPKEVWEKRVQLNKQLADYNKNQPVPLAGFGTDDDKSIYQADGYPGAIPTQIEDLTGQPNTGVN